MATDLRTRSKPASGPGNYDGVCEGCPRCNDAQAPWCSTHHEKFAGMHPRCKTCGHCVMRGSHSDDAQDLDNHNGFPTGHPGSMAPIHAN